MRIGIGYDIHPLARGRRLVLGGVEVPFGFGLDGWSDADVLTHALMDALLGAAALGDIGRHFPPGEAQYKGVSSLALLEEVVAKLREAGWQIANIDATILADRPRLFDFIGGMRQRIADTLGISLGQVSIKASTSNGLGFTTHGEGIAAYVVALLEEAKGKLNLIG